MSNPYKSSMSFKQPSQGGGDLEAKLQITAESFRRERSEANRRKQLAEERVRLAEEDFKAAELSTLDLQEKLAELESKSGDKAMLNIITLKNEVHELTDKVSQAVSLEKKESMQVELIILHYSSCFQISKSIQIFTG
jgi:hypothetical protein